jgi:uncharacterized protein
MLIEFAITNFRSIKERQVLSMLPSDRVKADNRKNPLFPIVGYKDLNVLAIAAIWGRNSAGKSNIIKAFHGLRWLVHHSHRFTKGDFLHANESFLFDIGFQKQPTVFEIDFIAEDKKRYLYIIEFNKEAILREELHYYVVSNTGKTNKRKLYARQNEQAITYGDDYKGAKKTVETRTRPNVLFLSKLIADDDKFLEPVFSYLTNFSISDFSNSYIDFQTRYFAKVATDSGSADIDILNMALRNIDTGILFLKPSKSDTLPKNITIELKQSDEDLSDEQRRKREELVDTLKTEIKAAHRLFDGNKEIGVYESFPLGEESEGTRKFIAVFSALMLMLKEGQLFIVDEFEKSFHPLLTKTLVSLVTNPKINAYGAQLIFTTHDDNLMDTLDNDQINLVHKDFTGASEIYTASDVRGLRGDVSGAKRYLRGEFEAIPTINNLSIHRSLELAHE